MKRVVGGVAGENAQITLDILAGARGPRRDVVLLNAGAALVVAMAVGDLHEGIAVAKEAIDNGRARQVLENLIAFTEGVA